MPREPLIDAKELARRLDTTERTVKRWVARGEIQSIKIGKLRRFDFDAIVSHAAKFSNPTSQNKEHSEHAHRNRNTESAASREGRQAGRHPDHRGAARV